MEAAGAFFFSSEIKKSLGHCYPWDTFADMQSQLKKSKKETMQQENWSGTLLTSATQKLYIQFKLLILHP